MLNSLVSPDDDSPKITLKKNSLQLGNDFLLSKQTSTRNIAPYKDNSNMPSIYTYTNSYPMT